MGCTASKDAVENHKSGSAQIGRGMSMPVQPQGNKDNGYHMVALTSSTYGILKVDDPKIDVNSVSLSNSSHDAFYEKLKHFDVPDEMVAKSWSEVSRNLPKIPPPTRTDSPRRTDSLRRMDSPRLRTQAMDSPRQLGSFQGTDSLRQRGSFRRTDSPRRLPSQATKNDRETINTWELMDGLDEDGNALAKSKLKPVERIPGSPVIKPFERSITFSTIHTLSELDSGDPSMAIAPGPAGNFLNSSNSQVKVMTRSASSPIVPKRDEIRVRLTPSSPSPLARVPAPSSGPPRPRQYIVEPMTLTPEANAAIQEVSNVVSKSLFPPPSPSLISVGMKKGTDSPRSPQPTVAARPLAPGVNGTLQEGSNAVSKSHLPPPSPLLRSTGTKQSNNSPNPRQPDPAPITVAPEVNGSSLEGSNAVRKSHLPPPSPSLRPVGAKQSSDSSRPRQRVSATMTVAPDVSDSQEGSNAVGKSHLPPPSPLLRSVGAKQSSDSSRPRQPVTATMTVPPEVSDSQDGSNAVGKSHLSPPSPLLRSVGTKNASVMQLRNRPPGSQHSKSPMVKAVDSPMPLNTKLEAEIERAIFEERGMSGRQSFSKQPTEITSFEPDAGRVRAVAASLSQEGAVARPQPNPRRVEVDETSKQPSREVPRFASPIHVLSLAASFDLENQKKSMSHLDPKAPPGQSGRRSFSKQQSMPSSSLRAIPSSGQGVGLQSQASAPNHGRHGSLDTLNVSMGSQKDSLLLNSDLLASFEEALEMLSTDERPNLRDSKGEATLISGVTDSNRPAPMNTNGMSFDIPEEGVSDDQSRQGNADKGVNARLAAQGEAISLKSSAAKGTAPRKIVKPDPWAPFELKCPPAGEDRVVLYTTSLRGIRKTFEDCNNARFIFESFNIDIDERDVSIHAEFRQELKELAGKPVPVPQAFIKGRYIGGMDIITKLHEDGTLATLVDGLPPQVSRGECDGCGGVRFVPCSDCSGSTKVLNEAKEVMRCGECNENGLMRCPICY